MNLVLITGASSGIGEAAARKFSKQGARVILVARNQDRLDALVKEIGPTATAIACDLTDQKAVAEMADTVRADHGIPDVVVNSAGAGQWKPLQETDLTEAFEMMQMPYFAAFSVTRAFLPDMLDRNSGVFVHVNSPACMVPWPSSVGFAASRAALRGFHEALAQDLDGTEVHSCQAIFGKVSSPYFDNNPGTADKIPGLSKTMRTLTPDECAESIANLARDPKHTQIFPLMLSVQLRLASAFPGIGRWLLRL